MKCEKCKTEIEMTDMKKKAQRRTIGNALIWFGLGMLITGLSWAISG